MAKETKAQREARLEAERQAQMVMAKATYTDRLMAVLERAVKENFELEVRNSQFVVQDRDDRRSTPFFLKPVYTNLNDMDLFGLEMAVDCKEEERWEREQKAQARTAALAKLTEEEKELLGL